MRIRGALVIGLVVLTAAACRQPPEPPRGVEENPPVEDIVDETVELAPESARVLLENDWVAVSEVRLAPGARLTLHREGDRVAYAHTAYSLRWMPRDGRPPSRTDLRAGEAGAHLSGALTVENVGTNLARFLLVTRSSQPLPQGPAGGAGQDRAGQERAGQGSESHRRELFRGGGFAVYLATLAPGASHPSGSGKARVLYALGPGRLQLGADISLRPGEAHWSPAGTPPRINPGESPARFLVFQLEG